MITKVCPGCPHRGPLPRTLEFFGKDQASPDGMRYQCRKCEVSKNKKRREARIAKNARSVVQHPETWPANAINAAVQGKNDRDLAAGPHISAFDAGAATERACATCDGTYVNAEGKVRECFSAEGCGLEQCPCLKVAPRIESVEEAITQIEEHRLKKRVKSLESEKAQLVEQLSDGGEFHEVITEVLAHQNEWTAKIAPRERTSKLAEATPLILASDWHIEHEIRPEQVAGRNRYNLEIATRRMERFFEATRWAIKHQREVPFKIRDLIFWIGGDIIQNYLHEDDNESNLLSPTEALLFAQAELTKGIEFLLEDPELEQIIIPTNDGNHGRTTKKMRSSTRIENSYEVFLYAQLALRFKKEPRVKIILPTSQFTFLDNVYGRTIRFLHGDVFKYGGGVGGITVPMLRAQARWETVKHADLTAMGHWHQRICLPNLMVNGSLCGYDPYAMGGGFPFEPPVQSLRMLEPRRWCSSDVPLWVAERGDDDQNSL